jgi:hypothetical protein
VLNGGLPEWPMGADCKSAGLAFSGSNPLPTTSAFSILLIVYRVLTNSRVKTEEF